MDDYQRQRLAVLLKIVHLLLERADARGLTHGEKHHFIHVARHMIGEIYAELSGKGPFFGSTVDLTPDDANDIPF